MRRDRDEVFHFLLENQERLELDPEPFTRVTSVRPCTRVGPDGFVLHESVCEYVQTLEARAGELDELGIGRPKGMPDDQAVRLYGGGILIFNEYGRVKYHIHNRYKSSRQTKRLKYLWEYGFFTPTGKSRLRFSSMHRRRASGSDAMFREDW
jgi:hypothetical protein